MTEHRRSRLGLAWAMALLFALGCEASAPEGSVTAPATSSGSALDRGTATIRQQPVQLEIVRTGAEQSLGLGDRDSLGWGHGMLFPYPAPRFATFWMKRMRFAIDIVWIRDSRIIGIAHRVPPPESPDAKPATASSPELIDLVLEVPAGYAQAHGWSRGDRVELSN